MPPAPYSVALVWARGLLVLIMAVAVARLAHSAEIAAQSTGHLKPALVASVNFKPDVQERTFIATIRPRIEVDQAFRVSGKMARRLVDVGASVKLGDSLAELDEKDLRLQKEQAESEFAAASRVFQTASADEGRGRELNAKGWNSHAAYDRQKSTLEETRSRMNRAQRAVDLARNALDYATLRADADGAITAVLAEPGQVLAAGQPAFRLARGGEKEALVAFPETLVGEVRGRTASLTLWSHPDKKYALRLREISPSADPATRTFAARFTILDPDDFISLGMSATLALSVGGQQNVARLPLSALFNQGAGPSLWTVDADGGLHLKPVVVSRYDSNDAVIASGVEEGDKVVVVGVQKLDPNMKVRPITQIGF